MTGSLPSLSLMVIGLVACIALLVWQRSHPEFDLSDLVVDAGKVSLAKTGQAAALVVSTWGFAVLVHQGKLTEFYFIGYMTVWAGYRLADAAIKKTP